MDYAAFDTETINRPGHGEPCLLLKQGKDGPEYFEFPQVWADIWRFLASPLRPAYVAYNMDFDARAIIHPKFLPWRVVEKIGLLGHARFGRYRFDYVSTKFLEITNGKEGFTLYDLKQFYGCGLAAASAKYLPAGQVKKEIPKAWYSQMDAALRDHRRQRILAYAMQDIIATQGLTDLLRGSLAALKLRPRRLSSCAALARTRYGDILESARPPDYVNKKFVRGFYGGRIEAPILGRVGPCRLWDINSAYPSVIAGLVDPSRGRYTESDKASSSADYALYFVRARVPVSWRFGPLAVHRAGTVVYPVGLVETWAGKAALDSLRKHGLKFEVVKAIEIHDCPPEPLLPDIEKLYLLRKQMPEANLAIKLLLNSIYGLTAEQTDYYVIDDLAGRLVSGMNLRRRESFGRCTNFILAAHITEAVRMKIWEVMRAHEKDIYFAATDGLLTSPAVELPTGKRLGEWGLKGEFESGVILGCGRYYLNAKDSKDDEFHLRGFPVRRELFSKLALSRKSSVWLPGLETDSLRQWASNRFSPNFNVLVQRRRKLEISDDKRYWPRKLKTVGEYFAAQVDSLPYIVGDPAKL